MKPGHWILMGLLCLIPLAALAGIFLLGIPVTIVAVIAVLVICPVSHILMMSHMGHGQETSLDKKAATDEH